VRVKVKVIAHSSRDALEKLAEGSYKIWVRAIPEKGKANTAVAKLLSLEFEVPVSRVRLISGTTTSQKVFDVE
jgi:uncharacterized protein